MKIGEGGGSPSSRRPTLRTRRSRAPQSSTSCPSRRHATSPRSNASASSSRRSPTGQSIDIPVSFFVDPKLAEDGETKDISEITLSYTFYRDDRVRALSKRKQRRQVGIVTRGRLEAQRRLGDRRGGTGEHNGRSPRPREAPRLSSRRSRIRRPIVGSIGGLRPRDRRPVSISCRRKAGDPGISGRWLPGFPARDHHHVRLVARRHQGGA